MVEVSTSILNAKEEEIIKTEDGMLSKVIGL